MTVVSSTSGRLHREFVRLLFLQETDRFFAASGVQLVQSDRLVLFSVKIRHYRQLNLNRSEAKWYVRVRKKSFKQENHRPFNRSSLNYYE
jgi:hypothetical protein